MVFPCPFILSRWKINRYQCLRWCCHSFPLQKWLIFPQFHTKSIQNWRSSPRFPHIFPHFPTFSHIFLHFPTFSHGKRAEPTGETGGPRPPLTFYRAARPPSSPAVRTSPRTLPPESPWRCPWSRRAPFRWWDQNGFSYATNMMGLWYLRMTIMGLWYLIMTMSEW